MELRRLHLFDLNQWVKTSVVVLTICVNTSCNSSKAIQSSDQKPKSQIEETGSETDDPTDDEEDEPEVLDLETILGQCGVTAKELEDPDAILVDKTIRGWPKVFMGAQAVPLLGNVNYLKILTLKKRLWVLV